MVGSLSCDAFSTKSGALIKSVRAAACYGGYVKSYEFNDYKNQTVHLYISGGNIDRQIIDNKPSVKYNSSSIKNTFKNIADNEGFGRLNFDENLRYLEAFKNKYFNYDVILITEPLSKAKNKFGHLSMGSLERENVTYIDVVIDLKQFNSAVQAKDALFFLRNAIYSFNSPALAFTDYLSNTIFKEEDLFKVFLFSTNICNLANITGTRAEYEFSFRGVRTGSPYYMKCITGSEFWDKLGTLKTERVDEAHTGSFIKSISVGKNNIIEIIKTIAVALSHDLNPPTNFINKLVKIYANWHTDFDTKKVSVVRKELLNKYLIK